MILEQELLNLLNDNERELHDFKSQQYSWQNDTDKSKLVKDIISFSNRVKFRPAYIIIGVKEEGGKGVLTTEAISKQISHLTDSGLQQLVKDKVDVEVKFSYYPFTLKSKDAEVGIIEINRPVQKPVRVAKNYGLLKIGEVYLRIGSVNETAKKAWENILKNEVVIEVKGSGLTIAKCDICKTGDLQAIQIFKISEIGQIHIC